MVVFKFLKNLLKKEFLDHDSIVEVKYFEKYNYLMGRKSIQQLLEKYRTGDIIFEPIRSKLTKADQEDLYERIDKSGILSSEEKLKSIIGLMMLLDGSIPEGPIVSNLGKVLGKGFINMVEKRRKDFRLLWKGK